MKLLSIISIFVVFNFVFFPEDCVKGKNVDKCNILDINSRLTHILPADAKFKEVIIKSFGTLGIDKKLLYKYGEVLLIYLKNMIGASVVSSFSLPVLISSQSYYGISNSISMQTSLISAPSKSSNSLLGGKYMSDSSSGNSRSIPSAEYASNINGIQTPSQYSCLLFDYKLKFSRYQCDEPISTEFVLFDLNFPDPFLDMKLKVQIMDVFDDPDKDEDPTKEWNCNCSLRYKRVVTKIESIEMKFFKFQLTKPYNKENEIVSEVDTTYEKEDSVKINSMRVKDKEKEKENEKENEKEKDKNNKDINKYTEHEIHSKLKSGMRFKSKQDFMFNFNGPKNSDHHKVTELIQKIKDKEEKKLQKKMLQNNDIGLLKMPTTYYIDNKGLNKLVNIEKEKRKQAYLNSINDTNVFKLKLTPKNLNVDLTNVFKYTKDGRYLTYDACDWTKNELFNYVNNILNTEAYYDMQIEFNGKASTKQEREKDWYKHNQISNALSLLVQKMKEFKGCFWVISSEDYMRHEYKDEIRDFENRVKLAELE